MHRKSTDKTLAVCEEHAENGDALRGDFVFSDTEAIPRPESILRSACRQKQSSLLHPNSCRHSYTTQEREACGAV
jgi:hypothetical protein